MRERLASSGLWRIRTGEWPRSQTPEERGCPWGLVGQFFVFPFVFLLIERKTSRPVDHLSSYMGQAWDLT